jgi:NADH-quinone oxidoreductase subunit C
MDKNLEKVLSNLLDKDTYKINFENDNYKVTIKPVHLYKVVKNFKDNDKLKFSQLLELTAVDYPDRKLRFTLVYIFLSIEYNSRIIITSNIGEEDAVESITSLFPSANWYEREVWDLFGITFVNHPDLRRILTDYGFSGFPLRKDFPLSGNVEVRYDMASKKVIYEPVKLTQDFRDFDFESPWEGKNQKNTND